jgi:hypothetical protein
MCIPNWSIHLQSFKENFKIRISDVSGKVQIVITVHSSIPRNVANRNTLTD